MYSEALCTMYSVQPVDIHFADPAAVEHPQEVHPRVRGGDRENKTDARAPQHQFLQTPPNIR